MTDSTLGIPLIEPQTTDAIQQANDSMGRIDDLIGTFTHNFASDANYTLAASTDTRAAAHEYSYGVIVVTDTGVVLTTGRDLVFPTIKKVWVVANQTAQTITCKVSGQTGVAVAGGDAAILRGNGTDVELVSSGGSGSSTSILTPDTATTHTAGLSDNGGLLVFNSASDCVLTVPQTSTESLSAGFHILAINKGGGNLSVAVQGTDTLDGITLWADPTQAVTVIKETAGSPNAWRLIGNNWIPGAVENDALTAPPATPSVGAVYIPAATATGSWAGYEGYFAIHVGSDVYEFVAPLYVTVYEKTSAIWIGYNGSAWVAV